MKPRKDNRLNNKQFSFLTPSVGIKNKNCEWLKSHDSFISITGSLKPHTCTDCMPYEEIKAISNLYQNANVLSV